MPEVSAYSRGSWGIDGSVGLVRNLVINNQHTLATLNGTVMAWAARFAANVALRVKGVGIHWNAITTFANYTLTVETLDAAGLPADTESLYDSNATITISSDPGAGWKEHIFATLPTTNLTVGTGYAVVIVGSGTPNMAISSHFPAMAFPACVCTSSGDRTGLVLNTSGSVPTAYLILSDGGEPETVTYEAVGMNPFILGSSMDIYGANEKVGLDFPVPSGMTLVVEGINAVIVKNGTPAGALIAKIVDKDGTLVSGTTVTYAATIAALGSVRLFQFQFPATVNLPASGSPYRAIIESPDSVNSSNCYRMKPAVANNAVFVPSGFSSRHMTGGSWAAAVNTEQYSIEIQVANLSIAAGGGLLVHPGMSGGLRG